MEPLKMLAVDIYIKGLPENLSKGVGMFQPKDLRAMYDEAVRLETRMEARIILGSRPRINLNYNNEDKRDTYSNGYRNEGGYNNRGYGGYRSQNRYDDTNHQENNHTGYINNQENYVRYNNEPEQTGPHP